MNAFNELGAGEAFDVLEVDDLAADFLNGPGLWIIHVLVLSAFGVNVGAHKAQGFGGVVFGEAKGGINRFARSNHSKPNRFWQDWSAWSFEASNGDIAIDGGDEYVAVAFGFEEDLKMAGMEEVKAAIDKDDAQSSGPGSR